MEMIVMELSTVLLLSAIILSLRRQRAAAKEQGTVNVKCLEEVARNSDLTKRICLSSLENLHKNLAALELRTTSAERQLGSLMEAPAAERREHYQAAALLLTAGHGAARVAALLDLPLAQVEMVGELERIVSSEAVAAPAPDSRRTAKSAKKKSGARATKPRVRPILLTDIVKPSCPVDDNVNAQRGAMNGAAA